MTEKDDCFSRFFYVYSLKIEHTWDNLLDKL